MAVSMSSSPVSSRGRTDRETDTSPEGREAGEGRDSSAHASGRRNMRGVVGGVAIWKVATA